jgi:hypothetical protein
MRIIFAHTVELDSDLGLPAAHFDTFELGIGVTFPFLQSTFHKRPLIIVAYNNKKLEGWIY